MANLAGKKRKQEFERGFLTKLHDTFKVGQEYEESGKSLAAKLNLNEHLVADALPRFERFGYIERHRVTGPGHRAPVIVMTLLMDRKDAWQDLNKRQPQEMKDAAQRGKDAAARVAKEGAFRKNARARVNGAEESAFTPVVKELDRLYALDEKAKAEVVVAPEASKEETKAIAGPEKTSTFEALRPLRKADDASALLEAARQYADRSRKVKVQVEALRKTAADLGVEVDVDQVMASVKFQRDDILEAIALVMPAIEAKEHTIDRLVTQVADLRAKANAYDTLKVEKDRLQRRHEALIAQGVAASRV